MTIRVFSIFVLLLLSASFLQVAICDSEVGKETLESTEGDHGIVEDVQDFGGGTYSPAPSGNIVPAGEESELLVGIKNDGESSLNVIVIHATLHLPYDHQYVVQNLSVQSFNNATVPPSAQATFPYIFDVSKFLQPGSFDLVASIVYEIDQNQYQSTFYNGTIEVIESGSTLSVESVFLFFLGVGILGLLGFWIHGQIQRLSKKNKRVTKAAKVEVGTATRDAHMDEWLQGTSFAQSQSKSKKKN